MGSASRTKKRKEQLPKAWGLVDSEQWVFDSHGIAYVAVSARLKVNYGSYPQVPKVGAIGFGKKL
tara:strand:- start:2607 stop:2801 length:195 start_codon:yes stop_codon:yes gene_type:complete